jgi:hypothetical protein
MKAMAAHFRRPMRGGLWCRRAVGPKSTVKDAAQQEEKPR